MYKGPLFNDISIKFTTRNPLGYEGSSLYLQSIYCPVINTVTPRPFYWAFMTWNYYEFWTYLTKHNNKDLKFDRQFLRRNDYYFVISYLLNNKNDIYIAGKTRALDDIDSDKETFDYFYDDRIYLRTRYGGMQYYNAGCETFGFIEDIGKVDHGTSYHYTNNKEDNFVSGEQLAESFKGVIENTNFYKNFLCSFDEPVSRETLKEYGKIISLELKGFDDVKNKLKAVFFNPDYKWKKNYSLKKNLIISHDIINFLVAKKYINSESSSSDFRRVFFDLSIDIQKEINNNDFIDVVRGWELVAANQFTNLCIEHVFKSMLSFLNVPRTREEWIDCCLNLYTQKDIDFNETMSVYFNKFNFSSSDIVDLLLKAKGDYKLAANNALCILFSMFNKYADKCDTYFNPHCAKEDITVLAFIDLIKKNKNKTVREFLKTFMSTHIIDRHIQICNGKLNHGNDGFYFTKVEDVYFPRNDATEYDPHLPGIRLVQLMSVMNDLGELKNE